MRVVVDFWTDFVGFACGYLCDDSVIAVVWIGDDCAVGGIDYGLIAVGVPVGWYRCGACYGY